jgi:P-type Cu2+ transporter
MSTTYFFPISGLSCVNCVPGVTECFSQPSGEPVILTHNGLSISITRVSVNFVDKELCVTIDEEGMDAGLIMDLLNSRLHPIGKACGEQPKPIHFLPGVLGIMAGLVVLMVPMICSLSFVAMASMGVLSAIGTVVLGYHSYQNAVRAMFKQKLDMDVLFAVSTFVAISVSLVALFVPGLPMMFDVGLLIFGFRQLGDAVSESLKKNMGLQASFDDRLPQTVKKWKSGAWVEVAVSALAVDDEIVVEAGSVIPVDGICVSSNGVLYRTILNGNLDPESLNEGDSILSGMRVPDSSPRVHMRVTKQQADSFLTQRAQKDRINLHKNQDKSATWITESERLLHYFVPTVFALAGVSGIAVGCFFSPIVGIQCAVSVLVSACPCTLGLVTGMAVKVGMKKAADHGLPFKSTRMLELASQITDVVCDLNGTLTTSQPEVDASRVVVSRECTRDELFGYVLALEQHSSKAVPRAMCEYATREGHQALARLTKEDINVSQHNGVSARVLGHEISIGNQQMMDELRIEVQQPALQSDDRIVYVARDGIQIGYLIVTRPLRKEALSVVQGFQMMGKRVHLCTGSDRDTALRVARTLGISDHQVVWNRTPQTKVDYIAQLQETGARVAMIGDAENDKEAIDKSDFGVAMPVDGQDTSQAYANMTKQSADAIASLDSLKPVLAGFEVSRQTATNIMQNVMFNLAYNITAMVLPAGLMMMFGIALHPSVGVVLMMLQTGLTLFNTYRFKEQTLMYLEQTRRVQELAPARSVGNSYASISRLSPQLPARPYLAHDVQQPVDRLSTPRDDDEQQVLSSDDDADIACIRNSMGLTYCYR